MAKHPSEIIKQVLRQESYLENPDGTFTHPYERELETSELAVLRRNIRLSRRPRR